MLVSLALITVYFRESNDGPLHAAQRIGVSVLMPFEVAGERVARPFRDGWAWMSDLLDAKGNNEELRRENEELRRELIEARTSAQELTLQGQIEAYVTGPQFPAGFEPIVARIIGRPPSPYQQEVVVDAGTGDGVKRNAPVVDERGNLVGLATDVTDSATRITLITDQSSSVSAVVLETEASGVVKHGASSSSLILDRVEKDELVSEGNTVITAGWTTERFESLFPRGIPIGTVESVGQQDVDLFKRIQIDPLVDFDSLAAVVVMIEKERPAEPRRNRESPRRREREKNNRP
ncbi:MAG: rod shape-determining protein MreC [Gaiellaceae bacterium]